MVETWPNQQICDILKKKAFIEKLSTTKRPERPLKTTEVDDGRLLNKRHFATFSQVKHHLQEVGISVSMSRIKQHLCKSKYSYYLQKKEKRLACSRKRFFGQK